MLFPARILEFQRDMYGSRPVTQVSMGRSLEHPKVSGMESIASRSHRTGTLVPQTVNGTHEWWYTVSQAKSLIVGVSKRHRHEHSAQTCIKMLQQSRIDLFEGL